MTLASYYHPHLNASVKLGRRDPKLRAKNQKPRLRLKDYLVRGCVTLPTPPPSLDLRTVQAATALSNIYLNDQLGDCVIAAFAHLRALIDGIAGRPIATFTSADIKGMYHDVGGYVDGDPSTDNGCDEQTAIDYFTSTGWPDGVKLLGSALVDATDWEEVQLALYLFGNAIDGAGLPQAWLNPMPGPMTVWGVAGPSVPSNGHCTLYEGYTDGTSPGVPVGVIDNTWGIPVLRTREAVGEYCSSANGGELHTVLTPEIIAQATNLAPNGFDAQQLIADLAAFSAS
jgi:hypothetical protein